MPATICPQYLALERLPGARKKARKLFYAIGPNGQAYALTWGPGRAWEPVEALPPGAQLLGHYLTHLEARP